MCARATVPTVFTRTQAPAAGTRTSPSSQPQAGLWAFQDVWTVPTRVQSVRWMAKRYRRKWEMWREADRGRKRGRERERAIAGSPVASGLSLLHTAAPPLTNSVKYLAVVSRRSREAFTMPPTLVDCKGSTPASACEPKCKHGASEDATRARETSFWKAPFHTRKGLPMHRALEA